MKKLTLLTALTLCVATCAAGDIHVSPQGDDRADGTPGHPLLTLHQALRQAREWRRLADERVAGGIRIVMAPGLYRLERPLLVRPEDSGTDDSPTIVCGRGAVVSGGMPLDGWTRGTDDTRVAPHLRDKVWTAPAPTKGNRLVFFRQMAGGRMAAQFGTRATEGPASPLQQMERLVDFSAATHTLTIPTPKQDLSRATQLEMVVHQRWAMAILRVKTLRTAGDNTVVSFHEPESTLEFEHPWPQPVVGGERGNSSFFLRNALELLDEPGEWYQDYPSGRVFFYPPEGTAPQATVPVLTTLIHICGTPERPVSHVRFEGLTLCDAAWTRPSEQGHVTLQGGFPLTDAYKLAVAGVPGKPALENQAWLERPDAAVHLCHARQVTFAGCSLHHLAATAIDMEKGVSDCTVEGCTFRDIGGTALLVGAFPDGGAETHVPYAPAHGDDLCDGIALLGNDIARCTTEDWGAVGIGAGYVSNLRVADNDVSDVNYSGICVGWGWTSSENGMHHNVVEGNRISNYARQLYDAGGIYTLSKQPGSAIRRNRIGAPAAAPYATNHRAFAIYFDEATDGFTVEDNQMDSTSIGWNQPGPDMVVRRNGPERLPETGSGAPTHTEKTNER